jgi:hypothetical protein
MCVVRLHLVGDARAVGARVLAQLHVHQVDVLRQVALLPEGDARAVLMWVNTAIDAISISDTGL